jgi:hypothetical protein
MREGGGMTHELGVKSTVAPLRSKTDAFSNDEPSLEGLSTPFLSP